MSRRTDARGESFEDALAVAISDLLDCDDDAVDVQIDAPGIEDLIGEFRLDLTVHDGDEPDEDEPDEDEPDDDDEDEGDRHPPARDRGLSRDGDRGDDDADEDHEPRRVTPEELDEEADAAADFLEGLLDALDLPGDLRIRVHEDHAEVEVLEIGSGALIGRRGQTLESIQELVRCALQRQFQRRSRVKIDAEGYRSRRLEKLLEKAEEAIDDVLDTGEPQRLEPMDVFERKAVHRLVAEYDGVASRSQGREPARRVIIEVD